MLLELLPSKLVFPPHTLTRFWWKHGNFGTGTVGHGNGKPCDFSFPTASSGPVPSLVSVPAASSRRALSCSRPDCYPVPLLSAQLCPSHPDVRTQQCLPFYLPPVLSFPHNMDATGLCNFGRNSGSNTAEETEDYRYTSKYLFLFLFPPRLTLQSPAYHADNKVEGEYKYSINQPIGRATLTFRWKSTSLAPIGKCSPVLHCPQNKKCGTDYNVRYYRNRDLVKVGPSKSLWVVQHCALSLAPCSPLKPPNDTPRAEELNQLMI